MNDAQVATVNHGAIDIDYGAMFSDARIQMVRDTVARDAPPDIFNAMIDIAKTRRLDPLAKQIVCVRFGSAWQYIVTIDGYRSIAEQTGRYAGNDAPVFSWYDPSVMTSAGKAVPESCTVTVYKLIDGVRYPFSATVYWEEYDGKRNNWVSMPRTMLAKVAESHALRKAFPAVLSGTYTQEEMDQSVIEVEGRPVDRQTGEIREIPAQAQRQPTRPRAAQPGPEDRKLELLNKAHGKASHDALRHWALSIGHESTKDATIPELAELLTQISKPDGLAEFNDQHEAIEADAIDVTPQTEPEPMFDADAQAALDADANRVQRKEGFTQ